MADKLLISDKTSEMISDIYGLTYDFANESLKLTMQLSIRVDKGGLLKLTI